MYVRANATALSVSDTVSVCSTDTLPLRDQLGLHEPEIQSAGATKNASRSPIEAETAQVGIWSVS